MSQVTVTARPLPAPRRASSRPSLRVIPSRIHSTGHGGFAAVCIVLLTCGLIALLLLNTALAQGSLTLGQLQRESTGLADSASNLQEQINQASASGALALKASQLGMVRSNERAYIDLAKGTVTGTASPASRNQALPIIVSATPPSDATKKVAARFTAAATAATAAARSAGKAAEKAVEKAASAATTSAQAAVAPATPKSAGVTPGAAATATLGAASTGQPTTTSQPTTAAPR